mgnify:FL=1
MKDEVFVNYAAALFSLAKDEKKVATYRKEIKEVEKILTGDPMFLECFSSYKVSHEDIYHLLDEAFKGLESPSLLPFLKLLVSKHLISSISEISEAFYGMCNEYLGIKEGLIYSTSRLTEEEISRLEKTLEDKLSCKVSLKNKIDHNLIGGVRIVLDGKIYDGSVENKIETLRKKLLKGGLI